MAQKEFINKGVKMLLLGDDMREVVNVLVVEDLTTTGLSAKK